MLRYRAVRIKAVACDLVLCSRISEKGDQKTFLIECLPTIIGKKVKIPHATSNLKYEIEIAV